MSFASCSYQTSWNPDNSSFTVSLLAGGGDLFQMYGGSAASPVNVTPSWNNLAIGSRPYIRAIVMESDPNVTQADLAAMISDTDTEWYIDDVKLDFDANGMSLNGAAGNYAGCFRKLTAAAGTNHLAAAPHGGLEICKDLVTATNGATITVKCIMAIVSGSSAIRNQGTTNIRMIVSKGDSRVATIYCDNTDSFVLDENNPDVVCKVHCYSGGAEIADSDFTRKWYLIENGAWVQKATTPTFTVTQDVINTFGDVKVECYDNAGNLIASDIQTVNDSNDGYVVSPNPSPADGTFYQTGGPTKIVFSPKLSCVDGSAGPACSFLFVVMDSVGNIQNTDSTVKQTTFNLDKQVALNINEAPTVNITAVEP